MLTGGLQRRPQVKPRAAFRVSQVWQAAILPPAPASLAPPFIHMMLRNTVLLAVLKVALSVSPALSNTSCFSAGHVQGMLLRN
eukprot:5476679-Amphidinium_carterae.1